MKLWVDDVRPAPEGWVWAKTLKEALDHYTSQKWDEISFDHDLGLEDSRELATIIEENAYYGGKPPKWHVHSANPIGAAWLKSALERADKYWILYLEKHCQGDSCMADREWPRFDGQKRYSYCCQCPLHIGNLKIGNLK